MSFGSLAISNTDDGEYFIFTPSQERIDGNGNFTFYIRVRVKSNKFLATSNTLRIDTCAKTYDEATSSSFTNKSIQFRVTLYTSSGSQVGTYLGNADNIYGGKTFSVTAGQYYYIEISSTHNFSGTGQYIDGYGTVWPIMC